MDDYKKNRFSEVNRYGVFGERLKDVMQIRNIQSDDLARMVFVAPSTISGYRTGRRSPDIEKLRLLVEVLEVSADYLLGLKDDFE